MKKRTGKRILGRVDPAELVGRRPQLDRLLKHAYRGTGGLAVLSPPEAGLSELLRQTYDRLFVGQDEVVPFYFELRPSDETAANAASRFVHDLVQQTGAFSQGQPLLIARNADPHDAAEFAAGADAEWIDRVVTAHAERRSRSDDDRSLVRQSLSTPLIAAAAGVRVAVIIDGTQVASDLEGGGAFLEDIIEVLGRGELPLILGGHRRHLYARTPFESVSIDRITVPEASEFVERLAARRSVKITDQTRDLIAVQLGGNATRINALFDSAAENGPLNTFDAVERLYTEELMGGRIGRPLDHLFDQVVPDSSVQERVIGLLLENMAAKAGRLPRSYWKRHAARGNFNADTLLSELHVKEIVNIIGGSVEFDQTVTVLADYLRGRERLEIKRQRRSISVGESIAENIKRAPTLMARYYRQRVAIDLQGLLAAFDGRHVSSALLDYETFRDNFRGTADDDVLAAALAEPMRVELPRMVYATNTATFYPNLNELCDPERSATGVGFMGLEQATWLAADIESKLEADRELAEFWCDRLEMAALSADLPNYRLWLIAPEGFSPEAIELLKQRNAIGSSRKQLSLLSSLLRSGHTPEQPGTAGAEYEMVVPMGEDTEMIAAHTIEEIAKRHGFPSKAINQIKTALVEACINAAEHSLSPDRRIHQKFFVEADRITITVTNRGVRIADKQAKPDANTEKRRGWGLGLMRKLMDEVRIENTEDGTRLTMVKLLPTSTMVSQRTT